MGDNAFGWDNNLKHTGLEHNSKVKVVEHNTFGRCDKLVSTGLETNRSVTTVGDSAFDYCTTLSSTGLENNASVASLGNLVFQNCTGLTSTGLTSNFTISSIGSGAFDGCSGLGLKDDSTRTANAGDLVLNQPMAAGKPTALAVGANAFAGTSFKSAYILCGRSMLKLDPDALGGTAIGKMYVGASWLGTSSFASGSKTFTTASGTFVVMDPLQGAGPAVRVKGTSDSATVSVTVNALIEVRITGAAHGALWSGKLGAPAGVPQTLSAPISKGSALTATADLLSISSATAAVYPAGALARAYNRATGTTRSCQMPAVAYRIAFDPNGGTGSMPELPMVSGVARTLPPGIFSRDHFELGGWNTRADGTGVAFAPGASVRDLSSLEGAVVRLYAQWKSSVSLTLEVLAESASASGGTPRPLAGCGIELAGPGGPTRGTSTGADGLARLAGLGPGTWRLAGTRAPAGYRPLAAPRAFVVDEAGGVTPEGGERLVPVDGVFRITLDLLANPRLPSAGAAGPLAPALASAGAATAALSCAYLAARRFAGR